MHTAGYGVHNTKDLYTVIKRMILLFTRNDASFLGYQCNEIYVW